MEPSEAPAPLEAPSPSARGLWREPLAWLGAAAIAFFFGAGVARHWFQSDDAFISFRYARHLADGLGPVWNPGERVEGYTNFSWVLLMAAGMRLGWAPETFSNVLGVASGAALLVAAGCFALRHRPLRSSWSFLSVFLLAASGSFAAWCTGGLETMFFALLVFLGFSSLLREWGRGGPVVCAAVFAVAALTRPEGVLFGGLAFGVLCLDVLQGRRHARQAAAWLALFAGVVAAHLLWRRAYYGDWVPNTFHAKVAGAWFEQGARYFAYFNSRYHLLWFTPLAIVACFGPNRRPAAVLLLVVAVHWAYLFTIGGDVFEFRFLVFTLPFVYWLVLEGGAVLSASGRRPLLVLAALAQVALTLLTAFGFDSSDSNRYGMQTIAGIREYTKQRIDQGTFLRERIESGDLPRDLVLCVGGAGAVPYYTGWETVDRRGLSDAYIASLETDGRGFVGHEREAPWDYLVERGVVVFDYYNQLLVKVRGLPQLRGPFLHPREGGRPLRMRAVPLGERALVFGTFVDDAALERVFAGHRILTLPLR